MNQSDPLQAKPRATLQQKVLGYLCLALFVIACLPMLGLKFGFPFHPSVTWVIQSKPYAWALAAIFSIGGSLLFAKGFLKQNPGGLSPKFWLLLLSCFPFFGLLGMQTVSAGFPMVAAMITGSDVELSYTVTNRNRQMVVIVTILSTSPICLSCLIRFVISRQMSEKI